MLVLLAPASSDTIVGAAREMMRIVRRVLFAVAFVALVFYRVETSPAQQQPEVGGEPPTKAQQDEDYDVAAAIVFGGLLGLGVAVAAVAVTRGAWAVKRRGGERLRDADETVKRLG